MEALERIQEYLDGELSQVSHQEVAHHFSVCQRCYPHLRLEEQFRELLSRSHENAHCPEHVRGRVLELLSTEDGGSP
jgi:mycothiol system anti-sigma-R factor